MWYRERRKLEEFGKHQLLPFYKYKFKKTRLFSQDLKQRVLPYNLKLDSFEDVLNGESSNAAVQNQNDSREENSAETPIEIKLTDFKDPRMIEMQEIDLYLSDTKSEFISQFNNDQMKEVPQPSTSSNEPIPYPHIDQKDLNLPPLNIEEIQMTSQSPYKQYIPNPHPLNSEEDSSTYLLNNVEMSTPHLLSPKETLETHPLSTEVHPSLTIDPPSTP
jgi:hypothetical protein